MQNVVWHLGDDFKVLLPVLFLMNAIYQKFLKLKSFFVLHLLNPLITAFQ